MTKTKGKVRDAIESAAAEVGLTPRSDVTLIMGGDMPAEDREFVGRLADCMVASAEEVLRAMADQVFAAYRRNFMTWTKHNPGKDPTKFTHGVSLPLKLIPSTDGDIMCVASLGTAIKIKGASHINTAQLHLDLEEAANG